MKDQIRRRKTWQPAAEKKKGWKNQEIRVKKQSVLYRKTTATTKTQDKKKKKTRKKMRQRYSRPGMGQRASGKVTEWQ